MLSFFGGKQYIDILNFFQCPLKTLSETFNISTKKGAFPHLFNTVKSRYYKGEFPAIEYVNPKPIKLIDKDGYINEKAYKEYVKWYNENKKTINLILN